MFMLLIIEVFWHKSWVYWLYLHVNCQQYLQHVTTLFRKNLH